MTLAFPRGSGTKQAPPALHIAGGAESLSRLDLRDQATVIEKRLGGPEKLQEEIQKTLGAYQRIGLTHALLASLKAQQSVTTNYDELFERACTRVGHRVEDEITILPYGRVERDRPWLLKLHGSLGHDTNLVVTRSDYLQLARERSALFGIVQALLVTKYLLFVGYSLSDEISPTCRRDPHCHSGA